MRYLHKVVGPVLGNLKSLAEKGTVIYTLSAWLMFLHILHNSFFFFFISSSSKFLQTSPYLLLSCEIRL